MPGLRLTNFSGGFNNRLYPTRVPYNQGVEFRNIDNSRGILQSAKSNRVITSVNNAQQNSVDPGNIRFSFYALNQLRAGSPAINSALFNPHLMFGPQKRYRIRAIEIQSTGEVYFTGDVNITEDENYQVTITSTGDNPTTLTLLTDDGTWSDPRDSSDNQILFTLTAEQVMPFLNKTFSINILPVTVTDNNPLTLDSDEILARLNGKTFFRPAGSSFVEYNGAAYYTRPNASPQKVYGTTRNFNDLSHDIHQTYAEENICLSGGYTGTYTRMSINNGNTTSSHSFSLADVDQFTAYQDRVCGNKLLRWIRGTLHTSTITLDNKIEFASGSTAKASGVDDITYPHSILDVEAIPAYTFKLLYNGTLVIGDRIAFDLNAAVSGTNFANNAHFPRITVLDYPTTFTVDPQKSVEQQEAELFETITQTKILLYTTDNKAHIVTFTRDGTETGAITLNYQNGSEFPITTTDVEQIETLGRLIGVDRHIHRGVDSDGNLNEFSTATPLYAKVQTVDMALDPDVRGIQMDRDSDKLWVLNFRRTGDPRVPTGHNTTFDLAVYDIDKQTFAISNGVENRGFRLGTFGPKLGYWAKPNAQTIITRLDSSTLTEDSDNLSLIETLGLELPPRTPEGAIKVLGFTPFNPQNLTFPSNIDLVVSSNYRAINTGGGESTRSARAYERGVYESPITFPVRLIIKDKSNNDAKVFREYMVTLDDEAIIQTSKDSCRTKGSIFSRRIECRRETVTNVRQGFTLDLSTHYSDTTNAHDIEVAIGIRPSPGKPYQFRQLEGVLENNGATRITTPNFIDYSDPTNLAFGATHDETFDTSIGTEYTEVAQRVSGGCRVRYSYTYYNANRDLESAPSIFSDEIALSTTDPVELTNFKIPEDPQFTDIRLYRTCPDFGETAMTLVAQLPLNHSDGTPLAEITITDELTRADLGGLRYNEDRELVYRETITPAEGTTPAVTRDVVIIKADGSRNEDVTGYDEQYNSYINSTGRVLDTWNHNPPPVINGEHINHLLVVRGTFVGIIGSRIHWSMTGFPDYWPAENSIDFDDKVTGTHPVSDGLLVFTQNSTHLLTNFPDPARVVNTLITSEQGCVNPRTPKDLRSIPIWISNDGICTYANGRVSVISRNLLDSEYFSGEIITTEIHNDVYYILYNNRIVSMDQRFLDQLESGESVTNTNFVEYDTNGVRWIEKFDGEDILYGVTDSNQVVEMFGGTEDLDMTYVSPIITIVGESRIKQFEDLYISYRNNSNLTFVARFYGLSSTFVEETYDLPVGEIVSETKFSGAEYFGVQFVVKGKGEVSSIEFTVELSDQERSDS